MPHLKNAATTRASQAILPMRWLTLWYGTKHFRYWKQLIGWRSSPEAFICYNYLFDAVGVLYILATLTIVYISISKDICIRYNIQIPLKVKRKERKQCTFFWCFESHCKGNEQALMWLYWFIQSSIRLFICFLSGALFFLYSADSPDTERIEEEFDGFLLLAHQICLYACLYSVCKLLALIHIYTQLWI